MPRPRHHLESQVFTYIAEHPSAGPETLLRLMEQQARQDLSRAGVTDEAQIIDALKMLPPPSTIGRMKQRFRALPPPEQDEYRYVYWPESFVRGILPWEASRVVIALLRARADGGRPTVSQARWAWRLSLAAPDAPAEAAIVLATLLAFAEGKGGEQYEEQKRKAEDALRRGDLTFGDLTLGDLERIEEQFGPWSGLVMEWLMPGIGSAIEQLARRAAQLRGEQREPEDAG